MIRIFIALALLATTLLSVTFYLGLQVGDYNGAYQRLYAAREKLGEQGFQADSSSHSIHPDLKPLLEQIPPIRQRFRPHFLLGVLTSLCVLLVNSISVTYFIGTSRWCKEVVATYRLGAEQAVASVQLKRHTFAWSMISMVAMITTAGLGGASDPLGISGPHAAEFVTPHLIAALGTTALTVWSFLIQGTNIRQNSQLIDQIMEQVRQVRLAKGLPIEMEGNR